MQNKLLMKFVAVFIVSTLLKVLFNMMIGGNVALGLGILVDAAFLGCIYVLLRNYRVPQLQRTMAILTALTVVSVLIELGLLSGDIGNLVLLGVFAWLLIGKNGLLRRGRRF